MLTYMLVSLLCAQGQGCQVFQPPVTHLSQEACIQQRDAAWHTSWPSLYEGHPLRPKRWYKFDCVRER